MEDKNEGKGSPIMKFFRNITETQIIVGSAILLVFVAMFVGYLFLYTSVFAPSLADYKHAECIRTREVYKQVYIPMRGKTQATLVHQCLEYEVYEY